MLKSIRVILFVSTTVLIFACTSTPAQTIPSDYEEVLKTLDKSNPPSEAKTEGDFKADVLKVNIPRNDLKMTIQGFPKTANGSEVMMGDLVLLQDEVNPVMLAALDNGIEITAFHNHFFWDDPRMYLMHAHGMGNAADLARRVEPGLDLIGHVTPAAATPASSGGALLDTRKLVKITGHEGEQSGALYKITVGRDDLRMKEHGAASNARMGLNTWAAFTGTQEDAAIAGDVAMLESEVTPVLKALRKNGLDVVAIHHHMIEVRPVVIFLHYWGRGPAEKLATGFKAAHIRSNAADKRSSHGC